MLSSVFIPCTVPDNHESDTSFSYFDIGIAQTPSLCVMMGQYDHWLPPLVPTTGNQSSTSLQFHDVSTLQSVREGDPEGVEAMLYVHYPSYDQDLLGLTVEQRRLAAMHRLVGTGYNKLEGRATTSLWMMKDSLRNGHFDFWGPCLDLVLHWMRRLSEASTAELSVLGPTEQVVLKHGIWSDIIAGATTGRVPSHIEWYRKAFDQSNPPILDCRNKDMRVFTEAVALASLPDHISSTKMAELRAMNASTEDLMTHDDESTIKAQIHRAGIALYLETVAHHGVACDPSVQAAVKLLCELISENPQREFAFWIFLAGCHAVDTDRWANSRTMMNILLSAENDRALTAASGQSSHFGRRLALVLTAMHFRHYGQCSCRPRARTGAVLLVEATDAGARRFTCLGSIKNHHA